MDLPTCTGHENEASTSQGVVAIHGRSCSKGCKYLNQIPQPKLIEFTSFEPRMSQEQSHGLLLLSASRFSRRNDVGSEKMAILPNNSPHPTPSTLPLAFCHSRA
jgi:hypothetical protein